MRILMAGLLLLALPAILGAQVDGVVVDGKGREHGTWAFEPVRWTTDRWGREPALPTA